MKALHDILGDFRRGSANVTDLIAAFDAAAEADPQQCLALLRELETLTSQGRSPPQVLALLESRTPALDGGVDRPADEPSAPPEDATVVAPSPGIAETPTPPTTERSQDSAAQERQNPPAEHVPGPDGDLSKADEPASQTSRPDRADGPDAGLPDADRTPDDEPQKAATFIQDASTSRRRRGEHAPRTSQDSAADAVDVDQAHNRDLDAPDRASEHEPTALSTPPLEPERTSPSQTDASLRVTGTDTGGTSDSGGSQRGTTQPDYAPVASEPEVGTLLRQRFPLEEVMWRGGMGVVFKAPDRAKEAVSFAKDEKNYVAIKLLNERSKQNPSSVKVLGRKFANTQELNHPNVINLYDFDKDEHGNDFIAMEFLPGEPLDKFIRGLRKTGGLPFDQAFAIIEQMGNALSAAHHHVSPIIHSDFKPGNLFITGKGRAKVFDFGIARAARPAEGDLEETNFDAGSLGALTPAYASHEMLNGLEPDKRDDSYYNASKRVENQDLDLARAYVETGLGLFGEDAELTNQRSRLGDLEQLRAQQATLAELRERVSEQIARLAGTAPTAGTLADLRALKRLVPDDPVLAQIQPLLQAHIETRLPPLLEAHDWESALAAIDGFSDLAGSDFVAAKTASVHAVKHISRDRIDGKVEPLLETPAFDSDWNGRLRQALDALEQAGGEARLPALQASVDDVYRDRLGNPSAGNRFTEAQADAYAAWLNRISGKRYRLPTDSEWLYAAQAKYREPSGTKNCLLRSGGQIIKGGSPNLISTGPQNSWGLLNHVGNVQEWTLDGAALRARGGHFADDAGSCDTSLLLRAHSGGPDKSTGFRLVREIKG